MADIFARIRTMLVVAASSIATACATPAAPDRMVPVAAGIPHAAVDSPLYSAVTVTKVGGGENTNPLGVSKVGDRELREAVRLSLDQYGYLAAKEDTGGFGLEVFLIELKQPEAGLTMIVDSHIRYKLARSADGAVVFDEIVTASSKGTVADTFFGSKRIQMTTEAAVRANIEKLISLLATLKPGK